MSARLAGQTGNAEGLFQQSAILVARTGCFDGGVLGCGLIPRFAFPVDLVRRLGASMAQTAIDHNCHRIQLRELADFGEPNKD